MKNIYLSLVVPFFNERAEIVATYSKLTEFLKKKIYAYELIFVNDGSFDGSELLLRKHIENDKRTILISYKTNRGRGYAVKTGFMKSKGKVVGYIDSDLDIPARYISPCLRSLKDFDAVVVSKYHPKSKVKTTFLRKIASKLFNSWISLVLGSTVSDHQTGLKLFRKKILDKLLPKIRSDRWLFDVELLYLLQKNNYKIAEVPIDISYGFGKTSKSFFIDFVKMFYWVWIIRRLSK